MDIGREFNLLKKALLISGYEICLVKTVRNPRPYTLILARGTKGYLAPDDFKIYIDRNLGLNDRVITLIHELLHELHPIWGERRVESEAQRIFRHLNVSQLGFLQFFVLTPRDTRNFMVPQPVAV